MYIVIHCAGMPFNGDTIKEKSLGGSETAAYYMAKTLTEKGHSVTLFTTDQSEGLYDGVKYVWTGPLTEQHPLGERFQFYVANTPHDVCIVQRALTGFTFPTAAKLNLLWNHDLALLRYKDFLSKQLWNIDGVLTVSQFHADQIESVYGIDKDILMPIQNGVDLDLFDTVKYREEHQVDGEKFNLLYSSRPERGLENLVAPGGIMERLLEQDPSIHLNVCGYDNVTQQMAPLYQALWQRCEELPNVTNHGALPKATLAALMKSCNLMVYPTEFEEVSCITAMECMAAGLPFLSSKVAALPETCMNSGSILLELEDNLVSTMKFVDSVLHLKNSPAKMAELTRMQLKAADGFKWSVAAGMLEGYIDNLFAKLHSPSALTKQLMANSDIYALKHYLHANHERNAIADAVRKELDECYQFMEEKVWDKHYEDYYRHEKNKGVVYGPENVAGEMRFESVSAIVAKSPEGSVWLDYGCAHGHFTINLAKRFPNHRFVGIDITESNIKTAKQWAEDEGVNNASFYRSEYTEMRAIGIDRTTAPMDLMNANESGFDGAIVAEVLEHMAEPWDCTDLIQKLVKTGGTIIITTPTGPWEAIGYKKEWPWRAHVHHFERTDIKEVWGHNEDFKIAHHVSGGSPNGLVGNFIYHYTNTELPAGRINYDRKLFEQAPRQSLSLCMIVKDGAKTVVSALESVVQYVDELVIGIDEETSDVTEELIAMVQEKWSEKSWVVYSAKSPVEIGFDAARNVSIDKASGDWILWLDADEVVQDIEMIYPLLRNNQYNGYALKQHHMSAKPLGVLKTDLPVRIFRNHKGIRFFGYVHEHPELELNKGVGHTQLIDQPFIMHNSYIDEDIRRNKFNRNLEPLAKDRQKYPDRILGKMLWLRDLAQMNTFEFERTRSVSPNMIKRAEDGIALWEDLLINGNTRMAVESLDFYSICTKTLNKGFEFGFKMDASRNGPLHLTESRDITARFASTEHIKLLFDKLMNERIADYERPYQ